MPATVLIQYVWLVSAWLPPALSGVAPCAASPSPCRSAARPPAAVTRQGEVRDTSDASASGSASAPRVVAVRATERIVVDGALDEPGWQAAQAVTELTQRDPNEGAPPSERTVVRILYDQDAIYVGARMQDSAPDSIVARLGRRDARTNSDRFTFYVDPYLDRRSGFYFSVDAAGTVGDGVLFNDDWDDASWDGVWDGSARHDEEGWTVEMRIPYSQLRFHPRSQHVWGTNVRREIARKNEADYLVFTPRNASGFVSRFAELVGLEGIALRPRIEVMPYLRTKAEYLPTQPGNPFHDGSRYLPGAGADLKLGIGSNLTLDATINPDFGQVEVDPAVVNLSDIETFFEERRPFFIEGSSVFAFGRGGANSYWGFNWGDPLVFYSRRIGRAPQGSVPPSDFADVPEGTTILGAAKLTGRLGRGLRVGTIHAVTAREFAGVGMAGERRQVEVEPAAYYGVGRVQQEFAAGRHGIGLLSTAAVRALDDQRLRDEVSDGALVLGLDGWSFFGEEKTWVISGWAAASQVRGSARHITILQSSPLHYFQRPDARHLQVDSSATSLAGYAARVSVNKQKGNVVFNSALGVIDPGFDVNDLGFLWLTDVVNGHIAMGYRWTQPGRVLRSAHVTGAVFGSRDLDGNTVGWGVFQNWSAQFLNYWSVNGFWAYNPESVNNRRTRGGPLTLNPRGGEMGLGVGSDSRRTWVFDAWAGGGRYAERSRASWNVMIGVEWKPAPDLSLRVRPILNRQRTASQWIGSFGDATATATFGRRYVFADLEQTELSASVRLDWTFTPKLSLQFYGQPLISVGDYEDFKELARPRSYAFRVYGEDGSSVEEGTYRANPDGPAGPARPIQLWNPDFNFKSLRGNAVLRWEYRPGSALYLVWTQRRSDMEDRPEFRIGDSLERLWRAKPENILMLKATYWWSP
ncbi:MAG: hypothetical protein HY704_05330 [Gemmatimonadetes bacterium]|nr:hypothetical protein [Gemmatimonadota bacterium]